MKIHLHVEGQCVTATLNRSAAAQAFIAMLPVRVTMHDVFRSEKFGALPEALGPARVRSLADALGRLVCWSAGSDLAVVYAPHARPLRGGFHVLGRIDDRLDAFAAPGPLEVVIAQATPDRKPPRGERVVHRGGGSG